MDIVAKGHRVNTDRAIWRRASICACKGRCECPEVAFVDDVILLRIHNQPDPTLMFTKGEWEAFVLGARDGEFDL